MAVRIEIVDRRHDFARLAAKMRRVGGTGPDGLSRQTVGAVVDSTKGLERAVSSSALRILPRRGGLARKVARSKYRTRELRGGHVVFEASNDYDIRAIDQGHVTHPVFASHDTPWVRQSVNPGWFTEPTSRQGPIAESALRRVMNGVARFFRTLS